MTGLSRSRLPGLRTLMAALLVPMLGGALGAAVFAYEYAHQLWRPQVTRTATGWRIVEPGDWRPEYPVIGGDRLVWVWGADTILMDLATGKTRLLGAGARPGDVMPASISESHVVFTQSAPDGSETVFVYDVSSGRRYRLPSDVQPLSAVVLSGDLALWIADDGVTTDVLACDLSTGKQSVIAASIPRQDRTRPPLADGGLVAWYAAPSRVSSQGAFELSALLVKDTTTGTVTTVPPPTRDPGRPTTSTGWLALRDGKLLGLSTVPGQSGSSVLVRDLATGATQAMGTAEPGTVPAMDADTVVWIERDAGLFGATHVVGRRLDGSPSFELARVNGAVGAVSVDGGWVAWAAQGLARTWIETARLPQ